MPDDLGHIQKQALEKLQAASNPEELEELRVKYLGRKGLVAKLFDGLKTLAQEERSGFGKALNSLKEELAEKFLEKSQQLECQVRLEAVSIDITADGIRPGLGREHIINKIISQICAIFTKMGFEVVKGPEVETEFNNFTGLNIPLEHPSRDTFDTFYIRSQVILRQAQDPERSRGAGHRSQVSSHKSQTVGMRHETCDRLLLRSHTSPVQIRVMKAHKPPLAVIVPGKVYRPDATDASHSFMFHQIEGFLVGERISFADLKGTLNLFAKNLFGPELKMRFRPHFFPFTEPSAEVDISCIICQAQKQEVKSRCSVCGGKGWLEILGAGMIHPAVFKNVGYPRGKYTGFAFGLGIERIAMLKYGIEDIRLFFENDLRFLRQF